jgi:hypothetical protein
MCFVFIYNFEVFLILRIQRAIIINVHMSTCYSYRNLMKLEFARMIFEKYTNVIFKEYPVEAELFHADGQI